MAEEFSDSPILIWQMGKVGSTSIGDALRNLNLKPIQLHVLDPDRIDSIIREHKDRGFEVPHHIDDALSLQDLITNPTEKFRIISLVRDPVARNLSALFESWEVYPPSCGHIEEPAALAEWFVMNFDYSILSWFEQEIHLRVGLNVYDKPFDHAKKRLLIENDRIKMLVLRKEDSQIEKQKNIGEFLGVSKVEIGFKNSSSAKATGPLWAAMKGSTKVSSILSNIVYESELVRHFYTDEEVDRFRHIWIPSRDGVYFEPPR